MTVMRILAHGGRFLTYDTDDVENIQLQTPLDAIDITKDGDRFARYKPGRAHLDLHIDFKEGKRPLWLTPDKAESAQKIAEGRKVTTLLEEALREELVPAHIVWRIVNRFVHGNPDGPTARPLDEMQFPAGQSEDERMAGILESLPDFSITLEGTLTLTGPVDLEILTPLPGPQKCEAWINLPSLYDSPVPGGITNYRLYCEVPAGGRHPVVTDDPDDVATSHVVHRAKSIWWAARSTPEDDDD
jgi:hypothetical protein